MSTLTIATADLAGRPLAGERWTLELRPQSGAVSGAALLAAGRPLSGSLDTDGQAAVEVADNPTGTYYRLRLGAQGEYGSWNLIVHGDTSAAAAVAVLPNPVGPTPGPPGRDGIPGAFSWYGHENLPVEAVTVDTAVQREYRQTLLSKTFPGGLAAGTPFFTLSEGLVDLDLSSGSFLVGIRTRHTVEGNISFSTLRSLMFVERGAGVSIPLSDFNSVSTVRLGPYTAPDGTSFVLTQAMLDAESVIEVELSVEQANGRPFTLKSLAGQLSAVTWYQTGFAKTALAEGPPGQKGDRGDPGPQGPRGDVGSYYVRLWRATSGDTAPAAPTGTTVVPATGATVPAAGWATVPPAVP